MYAHVCGCGDAASFASLQVCLPFFRLFLFSVCCFRMGSFLFPSLYARANIIMCVSFSSRVLRYKNMLCNTSVIQSITKKFQKIRIIFPSYVCWLSLKGLPLHPQSREMRHFRQCVTERHTSSGAICDAAGRAACGGFYRREASYGGRSVPSSSCTVTVEVKFSSVPAR